MVTLLVLKHFERLWRGHTIKANFITFHTADPEIDSTLIFTKGSGTSFSSILCVQFWRKVFFMLYPINWPNFIVWLPLLLQTFKSSHPWVFLGKGVLKMCSKFRGECPRQSLISIKLLCKFIEIMLQHGCSPVNLVHIFRAPFLKNISGWLLLDIGHYTYCNYLLSRLWHHMLGN